MLDAMLKQYDKYLHCKKLLDGSTMIYRQSPFAGRQYEVLKIENQHIGSGKWVLAKIIMMDSQRTDFITPCIEKNTKIKKEPLDNRMTRDIVDYVINSGAVVNT